MLSVFLQSVISVLTDLLYFHTCFSACGCPGWFYDSLTKAEAIWEKGASIKKQPLEPQWEHIINGVETRGLEPDQRLKAMNTRK